jgi:fatty acid desaturase
MRQRKLEWKTLGLFVACYALWLATTWSFSTISANWGAATGYLMLFTITAVVTAFHTSLQHEVVHGHPTPWRLVNEALVFPSLIFVYPFRRYQQLHLKHHNDANLTDPYEDPESYFWPLCDQQNMSRVKLFILGLNNTFTGRMILGPLLGVWGFYRTEFARLRAGETRVGKAWGLHLVGSLPVFFWITYVSGIPFWLYALLVIYPGVSWILVRSFAEHQASETIGGRTAIVEAHPFFGLLFLNNNLHVVHHAHPDTAWFDLPKLYEARKPQYLSANNGYIFTGYSDIVRQYAFRKKQSVFHPTLRRNP